jgi:hypothetical protein
MIRRRPRGETTLSKATYGHKRPRFDPPAPATLEAAAKLKAAECARDRAISKEITAAGGAVKWLLDRFGDDPAKEPVPPILRRS